MLQMRLNALYALFLVSAEPILQIGNYVGPTKTNCLSYFKKWNAPVAHILVDRACGDFEASSDFGFIEEFVCARRGGDTRHVSRLVFHDSFA